MLSHSATHGNTHLDPPHVRPRPRREDISSEGFIAFGKFTGSHVVELPGSYCRWLLNQSWISRDLRKAVEERLDVDQPEDNIEPSSVLAAIAFPLIVFKWQQFMAREFLLDERALVVVEVGLAKLKELCSAFTGKTWLADDTEGGVA